MPTLTDEARAARAAYMREWRANMTPEQKQRRREYRRQWDRQHPGKNAEYQRNFWERRAAQATQ